MSRIGMKWSIFCAALVLVLTVMAFLTVKMVQFEMAVAVADSRAATEERIRLALWRMDSAAAVLLAEKKAHPTLLNPSGNLARNDNNYALNSQQQRTDPVYQNGLSVQEFQQRAALAPTASTDWRKLEPTLLDRISDILPGATLEAVSPSNAADDTRRLASIPARLVVPASAFEPPVLAWNTPMRISLMVAWLCALVAAAAVATLLAGALSLSERRGAFVSAVTHELRTPLTTFRMYSEMLAGGMVADPVARQEYLDTLVSESDRLGHLVENVLAYARLERQLSAGQAQTITLSDLLDRALPALRRRAEQAGLSLNVNCPEAAEGFTCRTDTIAVQQILLNLVDNACKYGRTAIDLSVNAANDRLEFRVTDHGPGVSDNARARLFSAFSKCKTDAIPGIGLGLSLSRRLARALGGDLQYIPSALATGATFVLTLQAK